MTFKFRGPSRRGDGRDERRDERHDDRRDDRRDERDVARHEAEQGRHRISVSWRGHRYLQHPIEKVMLEVIKYILYRIMIYI